jgi:hypothetical protein
MNATELPANSIFAAAEHDRDVGDVHRGDEVVGQERVNEFGATLGEQIGAISSRRPYTSAMPQRGSEPCQLVSTPPHRETVDASPERVCQLWADRHQLERWWGAPNYPATVRLASPAVG